MYTQFLLIEKFITIFKKCSIFVNKREKICGFMLMNQKLTESVMFKQIFTTMRLQQQNSPETEKI